MTGPRGTGWDEQGQLLGKRNEMRRCVAGACLGKTARDASADFNPNSKQQLNCLIEWSGRTERVRGESQNACLQPEPVLRCGRNGRGA